MDSTLNLAFSIQQNPKGVYAVLLGAGISQPVGILTGWEVKQDIIKKFNSFDGEKLSEDIGYDELFDKLNMTREERNAIIRPYFEPTQEELEQNLKVPSKAHRAIAELVKAGYIKVILTTNFDRLLEIALGDGGVTPDVISSDDMLKGAVPLRHSPITIIKLHGDYRDIRTLNTSKELETYSPEKNALLDVIFDEYGLIVCGWSANSDVALRDALYRAKSRRYSTYWIEPNDLSEHAQGLIQRRKAEVIKKTADDFFYDLQGKVEALAKLQPEHPLTVAVAVERVKKLLPYEEKQIELEDLLSNEAERAYQRFTPYEYTAERKGEEYYRGIMTDYFNMIEVPLSMNVALCWYGTGEQLSTLAGIVERWGTAKDFHHEFSYARLISPLLLMYACSMAASYKANWSYLRCILIDAKVISFRDENRVVALDHIRKENIFQRYESWEPENWEPISHALKDTLHVIFKSYIPRDKDYDQHFDLCEMLLALICMKHDLRWIYHDVALRDYGRFKKFDYIEEFWLSGAKQGKNWGFLTTFFDGNEDELINILNEYRNQAMNRQKISPKSNIPDFGENYRSFFST